MTNQFPFLFHCLGDAMYLRHYQLLWFDPPFSNQLWCTQFGSSLYQPPFLSHNYFVHQFPTSPLKGCDNYIIGYSKVIKKDKINIIFVLLSWVYNYGYVNHSFTFSLVFFFIKENSLHIFFITSFIHLHVFTFLLLSHADFLLLKPVTNC